MTAAPHKGGKRIVNREKLEQRKRELEAERERAIAAVHRLMGAIALLDELLAEPGPPEEMECQENN